MRTGFRLLFSALFAIGLFRPLAGAAPGDLDQTFGGGYFTAAIGSYTDVAYAVAIQADGKYVLAGKSFGANDDFALARYTTNGDLDTTFGTNGNGKVTTSIGSLHDVGRGVAIQSNGMIVVAGYTWNGADYDVALARYTTTGTLDMAFGTGGMVTTDISSNDYAMGVAIQADGRIVAAGYSWTTSKWDFALAGYTTNGVLDTNFGPNANGKITTGLDPYANVAYGIALDSDGKIVVAGYGGNPSGSPYQDFALARYTTNGALDTSFSGDGKLVVNISGTRDYGLAVAIQPDGKIVVVGYYYNANGIIVARFTSAGSLDTSFSGNGWDIPAFVNTEPNSSSFGYGVAIQSDGKIVVVGSVLGPYDLDFAMLRYEANGVLDTSFGTAGRVMLPVGTGDDHIYAVAIQSDGKIVVAGDAYAGTNYYDFALARFFSDGRLDFKNGKVTTDISVSDSIRAVAIQADGKIVAVGSAYSTYWDFALARYTTNGDLDLSFSTNDGRVLTGIFTGDELAYSMVIQADGKAVAGGYARNYSDGTNYLAVLRYTTNGGLDGSWGSGGIVTKSFNQSPYNYCYSLAQQADGKIIAAGSAYNGANYDFGLMRFETNGALDTSFGPSSDGKVTTPIGSGDEYAMSVALQSDGKIVAGGYALIGANNDLALVRYTTNGALDTSFGINGNGKVTTAIGSGNDVINSIVLQSDGMIVAGGYSWQGANSNDFLLARYNSDGTLDTSFGTNGLGWIVTPVLSSNDICTAVALATRPASRWPAESVIVASGYAWNNTNNDFAVVRYKSDGTLDTRFGNGGKITASIGTGNDICYGMAIQADSKIVAAGQAAMGDNDFGLIRLENEVAPPAGTMFVVH